MCYVNYPKVSPIGKEYRQSFTSFGNYVVKGFRSKGNFGQLLYTLHNNVLKECIVHSFHILWNNGNCSIFCRGFIAGENGVQVWLFGKELNCFLGNLYSSEQAYENAVLAKKEYGDVELDTDGIAHYDGALLAGDIALGQIDTFRYAFQLAGHVATG